MIVAFVVAAGHRLLPLSVLAFLSEVDKVCSRFAAVALARRIYSFDALEFVVTAAVAAVIVEEWKKVVSPRADVWSGQAESPSPLAQSAV